MEVLMSWRKANLTLVLWRRAVDRTTVGHRYKRISPKDDSVVFGLNTCLDGGLPRCRTLRERQVGKQERDRGCVLYLLNLRWLLRYHTASG